jgi:hypothetical protein
MPLALIVSSYRRRERVNVRVGSKADISALISDVRFAPESGHPLLDCGLCVPSYTPRRFTMSKSRR